MIEVTNVREKDLPNVVTVFSQVLRDIPYYSSLAKEGETKKYTFESLTEKLELEPLSVVIAKGLKGEVIGFCFSHFDDYTVWIDWLGVVADSRKTGVGTALLETVIRTAPGRRAHKVWCDTRADNEPSKNLLRKMGFDNLVEIKNHWYGQDFMLWEKFV
jgi:ribosomal protein S18 acetylase RimI-like enzyme